MSFKRAISVLEKLYPLKLAETSWDNVGLLVNSSSSAATAAGLNAFKILLTVDLTKKVVEEALEGKFQLIVAYHPFIFRGIKRIDPEANTQHASLVQLIRAGISVYSPHTAVDSVRGGVNDWLVEEVLQVEAKSDVISPNEQDNDAGVGRVVRLNEALRLKDAIERVKKGLQLKYLQVASEDFDKEIHTIAVCAGSGGDVFSRLKEPVDLYLTGELSHHETLALRERGSHVIAVNHSNSERGYLAVMQQALTKEGFDTSVSKADKDPLEVV